MSPTMSYDEGMAQLYRNRPDMAVDILNSVLEEGDAEHLSVLLKHLTKAFGAAIHASGQTADENKSQHPLGSLLAVVGAMKMRPAVIPVEAPFEERPQMSQVASSSRTTSADPVHS